MLRLRPKLGSERSSEWRCCFCLHVRTGTMVLGIWHLMLHIMALGVLAMILREPSLLRKLQGGPGDIMGEEPPAPLPTPLSNVDTPNSYTNHREPEFIYHDVDMGALVTVCTLAITLMLIYGAVKGKPAHLLPFFCLQLFDFAITTLTATGYLCYLRSVHRVVAESRHIPWRSQLLQLSPAALSLLVLATFLSAMLIKAYCINMVWRCYKYLTMRQHAIRSLMPYTEAVCAMSPHSPAPPPAPLPDYEEALKQAPPPSYQAAMLLDPPPTQSAVPEASVAAAVTSAASTTTTPSVQVV